MKTKYSLVAILTLVVMLLAFDSCFAQEKHQEDQDKTHGKCDGHATQMDEMNKRGEHEMGFSQAKTVHHFRILSDGGTIEIQANDPKDTVSADKIRKHLSHIALKFSDGNFNTPMLIHGEMPPGVPVMQTLKAEIDYSFETMDRGGRIRVRTSNAVALKAIHEFLRFQITEHVTGDSLEVGKTP